jgi:hypothetical protein
MVKEFVDKWYKNKSKLEGWFKSGHPSGYEEIVKNLIDIVLNDSPDEYDNFDTANMVVIDHGDYQGMQIFIIPKKRYQPGITDYIFTHNYYGSCSGCDTLQAICEYSGDLPTTVQIRDYMTLALHLLQKLKWFIDPETEGED